MSRSARLTCLAFLATLAIAYEARNTWGLVEELGGRAARAQRPFDVAWSSPIVEQVSDGTAAAGLELGDRVLALGGLPLEGRARLEQVLRAAEPGGLLEIEVERGAEQRSIEIPLLASNARWGQRLTAALTKLVMPWLCLVTGFWVAFARNDDRRAWLFLFVMLTVARVLDDPPWHWPWGWREFGIVWQTLGNRSWPVAMFLFGISFPEPLWLGRWWSRLKFVPIALVLGYALLVCASRLVAAEHFDATGPLARVRSVVDQPLTILSISVTAVFFAGLGMQHARPLPPDERRRLILLQTGTSLAMTPAFVLTMIALLRGQDLSIVAPSWLVFGAFAMIFFFPLTMAYVVVVQRALDVRVVLRLGARYALARGTVRVVQVVVSLAALARLLYVLRDPAARRVEIVFAMAIAIGVVVWLQRFASWLNAWLDRKFFREAVDTERVLAGLADEVRTVVEPGALLDTVAHTLAASLHVERVFMLLPSDGFFRVARAVGERCDASFAEDGPSLTHARGTFEPLRVHPDRRRSWTNNPRSCSPAEREGLLALRTELLLPLAVGPRLLGLVSLGPKKSEEPYSTADVLLLRSVATQTGLALENLRLAAAVAVEVAQRTRLAREIEIARDVQQRLFPQVIPSIPGLDLAGFCRPALQVGGDYYDFLCLEDGSLAFAVGDVSGKGIGAALLMASLQASLRSQRLAARGLAEAVHNVNQLVHASSPDNRYATLFVGRYEPETRRLTYVNAGHNPPMLLRCSRGETVRLRATGPVVGLLDPATWEEAEIELGPGDLLVGYSDGISEALSAAAEEWGEQRLAAALADCNGISAGETVERVFAAADAFTAGALQHDDMTLVVLRENLTG